jgi:hypothetical protein
MPTIDTIQVTITAIGDLLWDGTWRIETITLDGQDGFYQLRREATGELMLSESGRPACFLSPKNASYAARASCAPRHGCST